MVARRRPVVWSPEARADLTEIWEYYADAANPQVADRIVRQVHRACRLLERHPFAGRPRDEIRPDLRSLVTRPYLVFYRVTDEAAEIVRVLDGRRDVEDIFGLDFSG